MAMESLSSNRAAAGNQKSNQHGDNDDDDDPLTSSAVRARSTFGLPSFGLDEEITATRLLADHLRPPRLFEVASLLPEDLNNCGGPDEDTEEEIVTSVIRRPAAENDEASVDDDPEIVDVIALDAIVGKATPPPLPLRLPRILPPPVQDRTLFLGTPRRSYQTKRPSHINMDEAARAALRARLEEVAAAVRRREIDFGAATDADADTSLIKPLPFLAPPAPPFADGGWPLLPWADIEPQKPFVQQPQPAAAAAVAAAAAATTTRRRTSTRTADQQTNSIAMAGVAVLLVAGLIMGLSMMRPKTYGSTCNFLCVR